MASLPKFCFPLGLWHRWGAMTKPGPCAGERNRKRQRRRRGRKRERQTRQARKSAYLGVKYALFKAGRISCQEPPQRQIPAEVLTIEEIWDILLMALPCHGRRFPLSGVNFWHPQTKARGWLQWLHGRSFSPFVCSLSQLSPLTNGIDKNKEVTAKSAQIPVTSL